ncbi:protein kinase [bacterium]|nr:protein kinase [bacterium]
MIGKMVSHYKITKKLAEGGMGVVYQAEDTRLKRTVALKFLPSALTRDIAARERFIQEAQAASALDHNNICTIHEIDETDDGSTFIVMACYDGETLQDIIDRGPLPAGKAIDIALQIARGLADAHRKGIVHRDVKPENIFLTKSGVVKVVDFGLAKLAGHNKITKPGAALGTIAYMSPEQARGETVTHQTDIWSLGVILYTMLAGIVPFNGQYEQAIIYSILNEAPSPLTSIRSNIPLPLEHIIDKAMAKDPGMRYQHLDDFIVDVLAVKAGLESGSTEIPVRGRHLATNMLRNGSSAALAVVTILVILEVAGIHIISRGYVPAHQYRIAVMDFSSSNGIDEGFGEDLRQLLSQSAYLQIISYQQLSAARQKLSLAIDNAARLSRQLDVARECGAALLITGEYSCSGKRLEVAINVINVVTGVLRFSLSEIDTTGNRIAAIDNLGFSLKEKLGFAAEAVEEPNISVAQIFTSDPAARSEFIRGQKLAAECKFSDAVSAFEQAASIDTSFALAYSWLARMYKNVRMDEDAQAAAAAAYKYPARIPDSERFHVDYILALSASRYVDAYDIIYEWIGRDPCNPYAYFLLGELNLRYLHQYDDAIAAYKSALKIDPDYKAALNYLGYAYASKGMKKEALFWLNRYRRLVPKEPNPYDSLGEIYMNLIRNYNKAEAAFLKAHEIDYDFTPQKLAEVYLIQGRYHDAEQLIGQSFTVRKKTYNGVKKFLLARLEYESGDTASARLYIDEAKDLNPDYRKIHWLHGLIALSEGNGKAAMQAQDVLRRMDSASIDYYHLRGHIFAAQGDTASAVRCLKYIIQSIHGISDSYIEHYEYYLLDLARLYWKFGESTAAERECQSVIEQFPQWAPAYFLKGRILEADGRPRAALKAYTAFLRHWKRADEDHPFLVHARQRITYLKTII